MKITAMILIPCFFMASKAMEKITFEENDDEIKIIIQKTNPYFLKSHLDIIDTFEDNFKVRSLRLYDNEKGFILTRLADYLFGRGLKFLRMWKKDPSKFNKIQKLCCTLIEDDWMISKRRDDLIVFYDEEGKMGQMELMNFVWYIFFDPCFSYYSIAKEYEVNNQPDYDEQMALVKKSFTEYFPEVLAMA